MPPTKPSPSADESLKWVVPFYFTSGAVISLTPRKNGQHSFPIADRLLKGVPCRARPNLQCHDAFFIVFVGRPFLHSLSPKGFRKRVPGSGREAIPRAPSLEAPLGGARAFELWARVEDLSWTTVHAKLVAFGSRARRLKAQGRWAAPGLLATGVVEEAAAKKVVEEASVKEGVASPGGRRRSRCQGSRRRSLRQGGRRRSPSPRSAAPGPGSRLVPRGSPRRTERARTSARTRSACSRVLGTGPRTHEADAHKG